MNSKKNSDVKRNLKKKSQQNFKVENQKEERTNYIEVKNYKQKKRKLKLKKKNLNLKKKKNNFRKKRNLKHRRITAI